MIIKEKNVTLIVFLDGSLSGLFLQKHGACANPIPTFKPIIKLQLWDLPLINQNACPLLTSFLFNLAQDTE